MESGDSPLKIYVSSCGACVQIIGEPQGEVLERGLVGCVNPLERLHGSVPFLSLVSQASLQERCANHR